MIDVQAENFLTPEQQNFAEEHHGLLLKFMGVHRLDDEYYGMLAERYVKTVKKYLETDELQQYTFSTILWYRLNSDLYKARRSKLKWSGVRSSEDVAEVFGRYDDTGGNFLWSEIEAQITQKQVELLRLRALGFEPWEIAKMQNCSGNAIHCRFKRIKRRLKKAGIL